MAQELNPQPVTKMRSFDQSRYVGDNERLIAAIDGDDTKLRFQRGERIICDFRTRGGNPGNQRGLADIRIADQTGVGEKLELEPKRLFLACGAVLSLVWH